MSEIKDLFSADPKFTEVDDKTPQIFEAVLKELINSVNRNSIQESILEKFIDHRSVPLKLKKELVSHYFSKGDPENIKRLCKVIFKNSEYIPEETKNYFKGLVTDKKMFYKEVAKVDSKLKSVITCKSV